VRSSFSSAAIVPASVAVAVIGRPR
jgi:hypothetical protein